MWCDICDIATPSSKVTVRITKTGHEVFRHTCEFCKSIIEVEYTKGTKVRITDTPPTKKVRKRKLKKNLEIRINDDKELSKSTKKTALGHKLR